MSTLLFLAGVIAFAVVAHWTYLNERSEDKKGYLGLLRMRAEISATREKLKRLPQWRQVRTRKVGTYRAPREDKEDRPAPRWKSTHLGRSD